MKRLLILGGGTMQLPAICAARSMGLEVHVADGNVRCAAVELDVTFHHVDLRATDALVALGRRLRLAGVFTAGTDFSFAVARVAEACSLPGIPVDVARGATDKVVMRERLRDGGVPVPRFVSIDDAADGGQIAEVVGFPCVAKPADSMGARGVSLIGDAGELEVAVRVARDASPTGRALVESLIDGREYSVDALVIDGEPVIFPIADRHIHFAPYFVELGHTIPADITEPERMEIERVFTAAIAALGITRGAAKGDIFLSRGIDGTNGVVGEIAARLSGGYMSGWTLPGATGFGVTRAAIRLALGEHPTVPPSARSGVPIRRAAAERAAISAPGLCRETLDLAADVNGTDAFLTAAPGSTLRMPRNNVEKSGNAIASAVGEDARAEAGRRADARAALIVARLEVNELTTRFFLEEGWRADTRLYRLDPAAERLLERSLSVAGGPGQHSGESLPEIVPLRVALLSTTRVTACRPGPPLAALLELLEAAAIVRVEQRNGLYDSDIAFWRAVCANGAQGALYVHDLVRSGYIGPPGGDR